MINKKKSILGLALLLACSQTKNKKDDEGKSSITVQENMIVPATAAINNMPSQDLNELLDQTTIGSAAGRLNNSKDTLSDVMTFGGLVKESSRNKLITGKGIEISFSGKQRIDGYTEVNSKYLNNYNSHLDTYIVPGKSTTDIGMAVAAGKNIGFDDNVIKLGIDLRSRTTWGKPQEVGTTSTVITEKTALGTIEFGSHNHTIGIPIVYLRGADLTLDINELFFNLPSTYPHQHLKLGFFPLEIGRGISLGAAYLVSPEVLSYAPVDVIQEFAPGFLLYGDLLKNEALHYRLYLGIIKNLSGSTNDVHKKTRANQYGMEFFPYRGSGMFNIVSALQVDWQCLSDANQKVVISPYIVAAHEGAGKVILPEDSTSNLLTYGIALEAEKDKEWDLSFECAINRGKQQVFGIDTNMIEIDQRVCPIAGNQLEINPNTSIGVWANSKVTFNGYTENNSDIPFSLTTDVINKNAIFLGSNSSRQKAINNVYKNSSSNGTTIVLHDGDNYSYTMTNSQNRFRDPYTNSFDGFMAVLDIGRHINLCDQPCKLAFAIGFASGDNNPNKAIREKNDHITDSTYGGFIGIQEIYSGKMVRSAFLMSGVGQVPRINSIPALYNSEDGNSIEPVEYPSTISGFNNLIYAGTSLNFIYEGNSYNWKWHPNILIYAQPNAREIHNQKIIEKLHKNTLDPFLGTEINLFLEILSKQITGFKVFAAGSIFIPGAYYKDLQFIPLNNDQNNLIYNKNYTPASFIPLYGTNISYYFNIGIEFTF
jgi:hypothetical protein